MYKFYNANALGKFQDDCTVRAISCATEKSWDHVYDMLSNAAQKQGTMMDNRDFIKNYLDERYYRIPNLYGTVDEISAMFPNNVLLITMPGHITCSKPYNGIPTIYDTFDCRDRNVEFAWLVK